jgi:predicted metal-dependent phosphoesterase TrpH
MQALKLNLYGIAFTEHYYYEASEPIEKLIEKYRDTIQIFRGVEVSSAEGHCLVFGVNTDKLPIQHLPAQEMTEIVTRAGGVVIPSHPYRRGSSLGDLIRDVKGICAVEGYNGCNMHAMNEKAVNTAQHLNLPYTGGSDAHAPEEVGSCYTEFKQAVTPDNLIGLLKSGDYHGVETRKLSKGIGTFFNWQV